MRAAVVLVSGGLDSATVLRYAVEQGYAPFAMTFRYGQRHAAEVLAAHRVVAAVGVRQHTVVDIDLRAFGGSALTADIPVPKDRPIARAAVPEIPATYVPARNTIFLAFAVAWAEVIPAQDVFIGANALDYSGYPDCRPEFIAAFETAANLGTRSGSEGRPIRVHAPLVSMSKREIIELGSRLGIDYSVTLSCYAPDDDGLACGHCDACQLRLRGFAAAGLRDPAMYTAALR